MQKGSSAKVVVYHQGVVGHVAGKRRRLATDIRQDVARAAREGERLIACPQ